MDYHFSFDDALKFSNLENEIISLSEDIENYSVALLLEQLNYILAHKDTNKKITLNISSNGGCAYSAFALYDKLLDIRAQGIEIDAVVEGFAASAACMVVLQGATFRKAGKHARFLLHEVRRWTDPYTVERKTELQDEVNEMGALEKMVIDILCERCHKTEDEIKNAIQRKEFWLSADEALKFGLIDEII